MGLHEDWTAEQKAQLVARILSGELTVKAACDEHALTAERIRQWVLTYRRSAREAFDAQLSQTLAAQGIDAANLTENEFTASLAHLSLADLLQTVAHGRKDAIITVSHRSQESRIWCVGGDIVDAESGRLTGVQAVYRILGIEAGQLHADFHSVQRPRMVHAPTSALLLEAARRTDESNRLRVGLGAPDAVFKPGRQASRPAAVNDPIQRLFDSGLSIEQALAGSERGELETLQAISLLIEQGHLLPDEQLTRVRQSQPGPESSPMSGPVSSLLVHVQSAIPDRKRRPARRKLERVAIAFVSLGALGAGAWMLGVRSAPMPRPASSRAHLPLAEESPPPPRIDVPVPSPALRANRDRSAPDASGAPPPVAAEERRPRREAPPQARRTPPVKAAPRPAIARSAARGTQASTEPASSPRDDTPLRSTRDDTPSKAPAIEIIPDQEPQIEVID